MTDRDAARQRLIDALNEEHNPSYWGGEPRDAERLVNDFASAASAVYVVTENAGYDVGLLIRGVFSTRQKADDWIVAQRAENDREVGSGNGVRWGAPAYDVEEYQLDSNTEGQAT